jgi:hypothetical protein
MVELVVRSGIEVPLRRAPVQPTHRQLVDEGQEEDTGEDHHGDQPEQAELVVRHRPRVEEDDLDVEHDEQHRHQIEPDREALRDGDLVDDAALVGRSLGDRRAFWCQEAGRHDAEQDEHDAQDPEGQDG